MPADDAFHETDATAFHGAGNDRVRLSLLREIGQGSLESLEVMSVDAADIPSESRELVGEWFIAADIARGSRDLQPVAIDNGHQVVQLAMRGEHRGFPVRAFGEFAIA